MSIFSSLFGGKTTDFKSLVAQGALIIDVRSPQEFAGGHIPNSINMPLDRLPAKVNELKSKGLPIITCCRSGARSGLAKGILQSAGMEVHNGGSWNGLQEKIGTRT
ncbi:rhodanese-like domain-containing protein [Larkinella sp. VNQ87]|uniref:rhodanese-like domain-containing protein n=1 Tax=Larkinella sp. VNQ87 TaxID=3400921 RepID=UPI003C0C45FF